MFYANINSRAHCAVHCLRHRVSRFHFYRSELFLLDKIVPLIQYCQSIDIRLVEICVFANAVAGVNSQHHAFYQIVICCDHY